MSATETPETSQPSNPAPPSELPTDPTPAPAAPGELPTYPVSRGAYQRLTSGVGQFALAIGACFLLVLVIMLISPGNGILTTGGVKQILPSADASEGATALRLTAPYTSWAPQGLPQTWRATSSRLSTTGGAVSWHLGYVTPADQYAALEQSNEAPAAFIARMTNVDPNRAANLKGTRMIAGATWNEYFRPDKKQYSLVRTLPGVTLVVTGTAGYDELATLAAALQPQPKSTP